jgi:hypothetical protein
MGAGVRICVGKRNSSRGTKDRRYLGQGVRT